MSNKKLCTGLNKRLADEEYVIDPVCLLAYAAIASDRDAIPRHLYNNKTNRFQRLLSTAILNGLNVAGDDGRSYERCRSELHRQVGYPVSGNPDADCVRRLSQVVASAETFGWPAITGAHVLYGEMLVNLMLDVVAGKLQPDLLATLWGQPLLAAFLRSLSLDDQLAALANPEVDIFRNGSVVRVRLFDLEDANELHRLLDCAGRYRPVHEQMQMANGLGRRKARAR